VAHLCKLKAHHSRQALLPLFFFFRFGGPSQSDMDKHWLHGTTLDPGHQSQLDRACAPALADGSAFDEVFVDSESEDSDGVEDDAAEPPPAPAQASYKTAQGSALHCMHVLDGQLVASWAQNSAQHHNSVSFSNPSPPQTLRQRWLGWVHVV